MIRENPASRGTDTSAEVLVGPPWRMVSNAGQQQWCPDSIYIDLLLILTYTSDDVIRKDPENRGTEKWQMFLILSVSTRPSTCPLSFDSIPRG